MSALNRLWSFFSASWGSSRVFTKLWRDSRAQILEAKLAYLRPVRNSRLYISQIEKQWAVKAVEQMATYYGLLEAMPGSKLQLTKHDKDIYEHFQREFPDFDISNVSETDMKSKEGKEKWRKFIGEYENKVQDFNFGTMVRVSPKTDYEQDNTIFGM
jgi:sulfatase maturation enzyme AslB (radical SAM superfamily)